MTQWSIDGSHSNVAFSVRHLMITNVKGEFQKLSGEVEYDASRPDASRVNVTIEAASVSTRDAQRDTHLRSADFLDAANHPNITFRSTSAKRSGDGLDVVGDLTIRGVTRQATLHATVPTSEQKDPWGNQRIGASATTTIRRSDFGVKFNSALEGGGFVIGEEVRIDLDVSLVKAKP